MKTFNSGFDFKAISKKVVFIGALAALAASCGSDGTNKIDSSANNFNNNGTYTNDTLTGPNTGYTQNQLGVQCAQSHGRIADEVFHTTNWGAHELYGPFNQGSLPQGGQVASTYVGVTTHGDIMTVAKVTDGNTRVLGYNVKISYCITRTTEGYPYIDHMQTRRHATEIRALVLDQDGYCGVGSIDSASSYVHLDQWQGTSQNGYPIYDYQRTLSRTYFKPNCNGQY